MEQARSFSGFVPPTSNFFRVPNEWINICAEIDNLAELKVIQYVLRHTWGYHEFDGTPKPITIDEFMHGRKYSNQSDRKGQRIDNGTGLSNRSVIDGLKRAIDHKYLICEEDRSDKARIVKAYALNMKDVGVKNLHTSSEDVTRQTDVKNVHTNSEEPSPHPMNDFHSYSEESSQRSEKETLERHSRKTPKKERTLVPSVIQPSSSLLEWIKQEKVICPKDQAKVGEYVQELALITSKEQMHRLKEFAQSMISGPDKRVFLGNLAGSLDGFLQAEQAMQPFLQAAESTPVEMASESDIEALVASIHEQHPEIVLVLKTDEYGPYIEMPLSEDGATFPDGVRDAEEWRRLRNNPKRLARVLGYGKMRSLVA